MLGCAWLFLAMLGSAWLCLACFCKLKAALSVRLLHRFQRHRLFDPIEEGIFFLMFFQHRFWIVLGAKRVPKWEPKWHTKTLQDACMRPRCSKKAPSGLWGPILTPSGSPQELKNSILHIKFPCFEGAPGACQEHSARHPRAFQDILKHACFVKSVPRYSKTSRSRPPS